MHLRLGPCYAQAMKSRALTVVLVLLLAGGALATTPDEVPNPRKKGSWVTDLAGVLSASDRSRIDSLANELQQKNGSQLAVVVLHNTDRTPKSFATALFNKWGIGQRGINNGVLVLVVMSQRRIEVEVGDGARIHLPDQRTSSILQSSVIPHFKAQRPARGIVSCVEEVCGVLRPVRFAVRSKVYTGSAISDFANVLGKDFKQNLIHRCEKLYSEHGVELVIFTRPRARSAEQEFRDLQLGPNAVLGMIATETGTVDVYAGADVKSPDLQAARKYAADKSWDLATGKLVGSVEDASANLKVGPRSAEVAPPPRRPVSTTSVTRRQAPYRSNANPLGWMIVAGGIVACGGLYHYARNRPRKCPQCGTRKHRMSESEDDQHLSREEILEEQLGSVNYDAWLCPSCSHVHTERWNAWVTGYQNCPSCSRRTLHVTRTTVDYPTYDHSGRGREDGHCRNCNHQSTSYYTIPRKTRSSSSSSSRSSGSSGFGGGRSSGGGSGASW
ncbi:MAG: hypothetical protein AMXMBFR33_64760 [Candidatus Xenobia bacterium]